MYDGGGCCGSSQLDKMYIIIILAIKKKYIIEQMNCAPFLQPALAENVIWKCILL